MNYGKLLDCFSKMLGLSINYSKSALFSWNKNDPWVAQISSENNCLHQNLPITYLGLPLGVNCSRQQYWDPVTKKLEKRLAIWQCKLLSHAGRAQLIRTVLNSLPMHYLSIFKIPDSVARKIIKLQRNFFWGVKNESKGVHPIKWNELEAPISFGGLGLGNLKIKNLGLLFKWWWKFLLEDEQLWKKVVKSTHDIKTNIPSKTVFARVKSGPFRDLISSLSRKSWCNDLINAYF